MTDRRSDAQNAASALPFGTEVKRPQWPMTMLWILYFLWGAVLIALAIQTISATRA